MVRTVECEPGPASWCNGAGAGPVRTAGRSTISAQTAVHSPLAAASSPPTAFTSSRTPADKKKKRKDKWLFTKTGEPWFCIAGIWRSVKDVGEAFTMLTMPPGPNIAPYHDRQIAILGRSDWAAWLDPAVSAKTILKPLPSGTLAVQQVG
jgi:SOS response associated peptidase (SRAP)